MDDGRVIVIVYRRSSIVRRTSNALATVALAAIPHHHDRHVVAHLTLARERRDIGEQVRQQIRSYWR